MGGDLLYRMLAFFIFLVSVLRRFLGVLCEGEVIVLVERFWLFMNAPEGLNICSHGRKPMVAIIKTQVFWRRFLVQKL